MYSTGVWSFQVEMALRRYGKKYSFTRPSGADKFGQPTGDPITVPVNGIYHEDHRWSGSLVSEDGGSNVARYLPESYILTKKDLTLPLTWGMTVEVSGKTYRLIKARDIEGLGLFWDLVLEQVESSQLIEEESDVILN